MERYIFVIYKKTIGVDTLKMVGYSTLESAAKEICFKLTRAPMVFAYYRRIPFMTALDV